MTVYWQKSDRTPLARLSLNSFWLLAARLVSQSLGLLFTLAVARTLGETVFGQFAFISAVVFIGNVFTTFGLDTLLIREVATARADDRANLNTMLPATKSAALLLQLGLSALFLASLWIIGPFLPNQTEATLPALRLATLTLVPMAFSTIYSALLRGYERMDAYMWFSFITAFISGLGGLIIWLRGSSLLGAVWVVLIAQLGGAFSALLLCRLVLPSFYRRWMMPSQAVVRRTWRVGLALAALMILAILYQRLGVLLLSIIAGDEATGYYSAAARVLEALKMIPAVFFGALFPVMVLGPRADERRLYSRAFWVLVGLTITIAALTTLLAEPVITLLYGSSYEASTLPLQMMSWSLPITVLTFKLSFDLVVRGKEILAGLSMLLTLLASSVVTTISIYRWSLNGAAASLILSEIFQVMILLSITIANQRSDRLSARPVEIP